MAKVMEDSGLVGSEFKLQSPGYVTYRKRLNLFIATVRA